MGRGCARGRLRAARAPGLRTGSFSSGISFLPHFFWASAASAEVRPADE